MILPHRESPVTRRGRLADFEIFTRKLGGVRLRAYQLEAAGAVLASVFAGDGETFVWKFARQGGKDETLAALYAYLMMAFSSRGRECSIVAAAPTFKPQTEIAMRRLQARLDANPLLQSLYTRRSGYIFTLHRASTLFFSADRAASVVGATAWPLLVMNEAQDIDMDVYDKRFAPMAAARHATRLFSGTAWTSDTLLKREEDLCRARQAQDGLKRVFIVDGPAIAAENPPYGRFLEEQVSRLGDTHPVIRSQYFCQEIEALAGLFNPARRALMLGDRPPTGPRRGRLYAFLIDVGGQDASGFTGEILQPGGEAGTRDSTALSIVEVDLSSVRTLQAPTYRVMKRFAWQGADHIRVFGRLKSLAEAWKPRHIVMDATGVGEGLFAMLDRAFPGRVMPVRFNRQVKSEIGWGFLSIIESGRFRDCSDASGGVDPGTVQMQYARCLGEVLPGPARTLRWGVPDGARGPDGQFIHDDHLLADALTARLDRLDWSLRSRALHIPGADPIKEMDTAY